MDVQTATGVSPGLSNVLARVASIQSQLGSLTGPAPTRTTPAGSAVSGAPTTPGTQFAAELEAALAAAGGRRPATTTAPGPTAAAVDAARRADSPVARAPGVERDRWVLPVDARISSPYGMRRHPVTGVHKQHTGTDFAAPSGTRIGSAGDGVVTFAGRKGGYGNTVVVDHGDGITTLYAHASKLMVEEGQRVAAGETIARVGSTGMSTGPHLHLEVRRDGDPVDPLSWLRRHGVTP